MKFTSVLIAAVAAQQVPHWQWHHDPMEYHTVHHNDHKAMHAAQFKQVDAYRKQEMAIKAKMMANIRAHVAADRKFNADFAKAKNPHLAKLQKIYKDHPYLDAMHFHTY